MWAKAIATVMIWLMGLGAGVTAIAVTASTSYMGSNFLTSIAAIFFACILLLVMFRTTEVIWKFPFEERSGSREALYVRRAPAGKPKVDTYERARALMERMSPEELDELAERYDIPEGESMSLDELIEREARRQRYQ